MGFNISSDEFWDIRPDYFMLMSKAYDRRQQETWLPFRRLMAVIVNAQGGKVEEKDFASLSYFDNNKKTKEKPIILSAEQVAEIEKKFRNGDFTNIG